MSGPGGPQSTWPVDPWCDLWKPFRKEAERLLGMGWQWKRSKMGFSPMGRPSSREPLGGSPLGYCPSPLLPSLSLLSILAYWNHHPYHPPPLPPMHPPQPLTCTTCITCTTPGAKCLKKFVGQKRNALRRLICGTWTMPRHGGATRWRRSLEQLERLLSVPIAPLFGIVPSTRSQPLPEWLVW